jgi:phosphohistidine phosphatase SixA
MSVDRRRWLQAAALASCSPMLPVRAAGNPADGVAASLRQGGVVIAFRHADAPGTFDPPGMRLDDCRTQRNLGEAGRAQAQRLGRWFAEQRLVPEQVLSSPWCRCRDTATLAFGRGEVWAPLGSPHGSDPAARAAQGAALRQALAARRGRSGFDVWVTHMFVLADLTGENSDSAQGLVLRSGTGGRVEVLARLAPPPLG